MELLRASQGLGSGRNASASERLALQVLQGVDFDVTRAVGLERRVWRQLVVHAEPLLERAVEVTRVVAGLRGVVQLLTARLLVGAGGRALKCPKRQKNKGRERQQPARAPSTQRARVARPERPSPLPTSACRAHAVSIVGGA